MSVKEKIMFCLGIFLLCASFYAIGEVDRKQKKKFLEAQKRLREMELQEKFDFEVAKLKNKVNN